MAACKSFYPYIKDINNVLLIAEVEARPPLYDKILTQYNDLGYKKILWEEITEKLFPECWCKMTEDEKEFRVSEVIKRWTNLRTCFSRELKALSTCSQNMKRRKYVYFESLMFLVKNNCMAPRHYDPETIAMYHNDSDAESVSNSEASHAEKTPPPEKAPKVVKKKVKKKPDGNKEEFTRKDVEKYIQNSLSILKNELANKPETEDLSMNMNNTPQAFNSDPDANFALSLAPMLRTVPSGKKLDAQIEILNVLKKYTVTELAINSIIKFEKGREDPLDDDEEAETLYYSDVEK